MTKEQKEQVIILRRAGCLIADIATEVGAPYNTVKTHCYRHITIPAQRPDPLPKPQPSPKPDCCQNCGKRIVQQPKRKPRKFCSPKCRETWWNRNHRADGLCVVQCAYCGKAFEKYMHAAKRFCCHQCYIFDRFGEVPQK